jgi:hypothetical protein
MSIVALRMKMQFKRHKSLGTDQILAELIQAGGEILCSEIQKLINSIWNKEELPQQWKKSILVPFIRMPTKMTLVIIETYHYYQLHTKFYAISFS